MSLHPAFQSSQLSDQALFAWSWEGGAPAPPETTEPSRPTSGHWCMLLTLLGDAFTLRHAAKQGGYTFDHGEWTHAFSSRALLFRDQAEVRHLQALVLNETRRFPRGGRASEPQFILTDCPA